MLQKIKACIQRKHIVLYLTIILPSVIRRVDRTIHWRKPYALDNVISFGSIYPAEWFTCWIKLSIGSITILWVGFACTYPPNNDLYTIKDHPNFQQLKLFSALTPRVNFKIKKWKTPSQNTIIISSTCSRTQRRMKQPGFHFKDAYCCLFLPFSYVIPVEIRQENWTFYHQVTPLVNLMMSRQNWIKSIEVWSKCH